VSVRPRSDFRVEAPNINVLRLDSHPDRVKSTFKLSNTHNNSRDLWKILSKINMLGEHSITYSLIQPPGGVRYAKTKPSVFDLRNISFQR
jgi:hypothetical protein